MTSRLTLAAVLAAAMALTATAASAIGPGSGGSASAPPATAAAGCTGSVQFSDDFTQANDPSWPVPRDDIVISGGKFLGKAPPGKDYWALTQAYNLADGDEVCFDLAVQQVSDPSSISGGLDFWEVDNKNYYSLSILPNGYAYLARAVNGSWSYPISYRQAASLKTGAGATNSVRLTLKSNKISIYFNGQPWYQNVSGVEPKNSSGWGFDYSSEKNASNVWIFSNLRVTHPQ